MRRLTLIVLLLLLAPPARAALGRPALAVHAGAALSPSEGLSRDDVSGGGLMMGASALWGWDDRFRFGISGFGADFGSRLESVRGLGGSDSPQELGTIESVHRGAWGAGWRVDAMGPPTRRWGRSFATLTYQVARYGADRQGRSLETRNAMAVFLGAGWERAFGSHIELALSAGPTVFAAEDTERFIGAQLEWRWIP